MTHVFLDMDGVIVDFVRGACELHKAENPYIHEKNLGLWDIDELMGIEKKTFWGAMDMAFWENLHFTPDANILLGRVTRHTNDITILTSPTNGDSVNGKFKWIERCMPQWRRRYLMGPGKFAAAGPGKLLIDDYNENVDSWVKAGGPAILVPRPWNRNHALPTVEYVTQRLSEHFNAN